MKMMMVFILGAFLSTSCSHFGEKDCCKGKEAKSCCGKKDCKDGSCDLKKKKKKVCEKCEEQTCMDGNCDLKRD